MRLSFKPNATCRPTRNLYVVCERFLYVQTSKQLGKNCQLVAPPPPGGGSPSHGTTGTKFNRTLLVLVRAPGPEPSQALP